MYLSSIVIAIVGVICILIGISNRKGNIDSLHSYHRKRVKEEDRLPFGKLVGLGMIIIGASLVITGVLQCLGTLGDSMLCCIIASFTAVAGITAGLWISFFAMIKYNKGIF